MAKGCSSERTCPKEDPGANLFGTGEEKQELKRGECECEQRGNSHPKSKKKKIEKKGYSILCPLKKGARAATVSTRSCSPLGKELPLVAVGFAA